MTSLRNRPVSNAAYHLEPELDGWRQEPWDREYSHRFRFNNTRVQRKSNCQIINNFFFFSLGKLIELKS